MQTASQLSPQQSAVVEWCRTGRGSLNVVARAGTGKTHLLIEGVIRYTYTQRPKDCVAIMVYNKAADDEIKDRLTKTDFIQADPIDSWKRVKSGTVHSFGFAAWRKVAPGVATDRDKVKKIVREIAEADPLGIGEDAVSPYTLCEGLICKAVSLAKQRAIGFLKQVGDRSAWYDLVDHFGLDEDLADEISVDCLIDMSIKVLTWSFSVDREVIDFDDMILAPLVHKARFWTYDWILLDEAQDTNPARRALAFALMKPRFGRMIAVGDDRQAIYGFTGADADSMDLIRRALNSKVLPLTVTRRCPRAVVELAKTLVPDYVAHEDAPEGVVRSLPHTRETEDRQNLIHWYDGEDLKYGDAIICRNTKPLIDEAYALIRADIGCMVEGRDIGAGLVALATRWKSIRNLTPLRDKLEEYKGREIQKYLAKEQEEKAAAIEDRVGTLQVMIDKCVASGKRTIEDLKAAIEDLFGDSTAEDARKCVLLMTAHRSKGREFDRVYGLGRRTYMPSKYARKPHQMIQEENLEYVKITRAKREYIDIELRG